MPTTEKRKAEACLAHRESDRVRAAYNRAELLAQRKALLQAWADYLDGQGPQAQAVGAHRAPADLPAAPVHGSGDPLAYVPAVADLMGVS